MYFKKNLLKKSKTLNWIFLSFEDMLSDMKTESFIILPKAFEICRNFSRFVNEVLVYFKFI